MRPAGTTTTNDHVAHANNNIDSQRQMMLLQQEAHYESERQRMTVEIVHELSQMVTNVNSLTRNLDTITTISQDFGQLAELWKHFFKTSHQQQLEEQQQHKQQQPQEYQGQQLSQQESEDEGAGL